MAETSDAAHTNSGEVKKRSKLRRTAIGVLSHAYNLAADIADERIDSDSTAGITAGAAASLLSIGLERVRAPSLEEGENEALGLPNRTSILDIEADPFDSDMSFDDNNESLNSSRRSSFGESSTQDHFIDKLLEKLLVHAIPRKERENLSLKLHDPHRTKKPNLSIRIMVKNFRKLSSRMSGLFTMQYGTVHVLTWRRPTVTLSVLVIYTLICIYPHLVLVLPLLYLLYGIMAPSYIYRHPLDIPEIRKVKKRGRSIFDFLLVSDESSSLANKLVSDSIGNPKVPGDVPPVNESEFPPLEELDKIELSARSLKNQMELLINMRDLQNLTTDVINVFDQIERFLYGTGAFADERISTSLFISVLGMVVIVLFFGFYIPWRLIFIASGWALIGSCHPSSSKVLESVNRMYLKPQKKKMDKTIQRSEIKDIILDEPPVVKEVEIFELEEQGWTPSQWNPYGFTTDIFDKLAKLKQQLPTRCSMINEVLPPLTWKFDEEKSWKVDTSSLWVRDTTEMRTMGPDGWVYDVDGDSIGRWRRRRWTRDCYRYARPARRVRH